MPVQKILTELDTTRSARESLYKHFHRIPELALQEHQTSEKIREELESYGVEVIRIGDTGVVGVIENGDGPVVAMRADIDALPMAEESGKDYAAEGAMQVDENTGKETPVAHTCGHDVHIVSLLGATQSLADHRDAWSGTFLAVFQPGEENATGARAMVDAGIVSKLPKPDVYLGQHVLGILPGGAVGTRAGIMLTAASSVEVTVHGKGAHGAMPNLSVDPVVLGASIVSRLQTIVSREIAAQETAVLTVGSFQSGTGSDSIPDTAVLQLNTRTYDAAVEKHLHEAIERTVRAECEIARSPKEPEFRYYRAFPRTENHEEPTARVRAAFDAYFSENSTDLAAQPASEDFSIVPDAFGSPYTYWALGGFVDHKNAPHNHSRAFAPDLQPTLDRGVEAIIVAASAWLIQEP